EFAAAGPGYLALAGTDRYGYGAAQPRQVGPVVRPMARFLQPENVLRLDQPREAKGLVIGPALVWVRHEGEAGTGAFARGADTFGVFFRRLRSHLQLAAGKTLLAKVCHFPSDRGEII